MDDQNDNQTANAKGGTRPSHVAYHVRENDEGKAFFNRVGSAFAHKDGKGFNVLLDATPVDGKITLRTAEERIKAAKDGRNGQNASQGREDGR
ncbi:MAG: hypothetical protein ACE360_00545 [Hyphomicrobiales bacterium]